MTISDKIIRNKLGLLNLAEELGNVSKACNIMGFSRGTFYVGTIKRVGRICERFNRTILEKCY